MGGATLDRKGYADRRGWSGLTLIVGCGCSPTPLLNFLTGEWTASSTFHGIRPPPQAVDALTWLLMTCHFSNILRLLSCASAFQAPVDVSLEAGIYGMWHVWSAIWAFVDEPFATPAKRNKTHRRIHRRRRIHRMPVEPKAPHTSKRPRCEGHPTDKGTERFSGGYMDRQWSTTMHHMHIVDIIVLPSHPDLGW